MVEAKTEGQQNAASLWSKEKSSFSSLYESVSYPFQYFFVHLLFVEAHYIFLLLICFAFVSLFFYLNNVFLFSLSNFFKYSLPVHSFSFHQNVRIIFLVALVNRLVRTSPSWERRRKKKPLMRSQRGRLLISPKLKRNSMVLQLTRNSLISLNSSTPVFIS